jgi:rubrerythrin
MKFAMEGKSMGQSEKQMVAFFEDQQKLEKKVVRSVNKALKDIKNPVVKSILKGISYDSAKHAQIYMSAIEIITVAPALKEEQFKNLEKVVKWHIEMEEEMISRLRETLGKTPNDRVKFLLESILEDEKRHHDLLNLVMGIIVKKETITDEEWWDLMWKYVPFHGAPGG